MDIAPKSSLGGRHDLLYHRYPMMMTMDDDDDVGGGTLLLLGHCLVVVGGEGRHQRQRHGGVGHDDVALERGAVAGEGVGVDVEAEAEREEDSSAFIFAMSTPPTRAK
jgi:hypothetical protein